LQVVAEVELVALDLMVLYQKAEMEERVQVLHHYQVVHFLVVAVDQDQLTITKPVDVVVQVVVVKDKEILLQSQQQMEQQILVVEVGEEQIILPLILEQMVVQE
tara:strand:- start:209 stop:520 length:312 start_codon:yes stop_codon:yes gene_type:complete